MKKVIVIMSIMVILIVLLKNFLIKNIDYEMDYYNDQYEQNVDQDSEWFGVKTNS